MTFHYLHLRDWAIFDQLKLEEGLLRADDRNFFLISEGSRLPSIVMGISGKLEQLVDRDRLSSLDIPLIRRFSGGGTVVVDEETLFVTFIGDKSLLENASPETVLKWAESIFQRALGHPEFHLRENDFAIGEKNAAEMPSICRKTVGFFIPRFSGAIKKNGWIFCCILPKLPRIDWEGAMRTSSAAWKSIFLPNRKFPRASLQKCKNALVFRKRILRRSRRFLQDLRIDDLRG